jgi:hypothetical protein
MSTGEAEIRKFLEALGNALTAGDLDAVSKCWDIPAILLSDQGSVVINSAAQIRRSFSHAVQWYRSRGLVSTKPEIQKLEQLTEALCAVDVRWPAFDAAGVEKSSERSHYIIKVAVGDEPRICIALSRTF